jgi:lysophospholipase L1-like esterase
VAFGEGTPNPTELGYTSVLNRWFHAEDCIEGAPEACPGLELVNLAVPGATSTTLISVQLADAVQLIGERGADANPNNDVVLITLTVGGNDLFDPVVAACSGGQTPECIQTIQTVFATTGQNLAVILGSLRESAGPDTKIVIMTYDNPLGSCRLSALEPLGDLVLEGNSNFPGFNDIIRSVAGALDVRVAETFGQLAPDDWVGGDDCRHPDTSGHHKIAEIFLAA